MAEMTTTPPASFLDPGGSDRGRAAPRGLVPTRSPALLGSLLLHIAALLFLLHRVATGDLEKPVRIVPVELVPLADRTTEPVPPKPELPKQQTASVRPQTKKAPPQLIPLPLPKQTLAAPETGTEPVPLPPKDELQSRLEAFAKLNLPGTGAASATSNGPGYGPSGYDVRDFIRAQVERRWSLDLDSIEDQKVTVSIHVVLTPDGVIRKAEIVNDRGTDAAYHSLAISARNAVILSSPITLPVGTPGTMLDVVLNLSPKDTLN
jgi:hypothetical protein